MSTDTITKTEKSYEVTYSMVGITNPETKVNYLKGEKIPSSKMSNTVRKRLLDMSAIKLFVEEEPEIFDTEEDSS